MGYGMPVDGSGAAPFPSRTPPDRVSMSFEQYCDGLLACVAHAPPTPDQMAYLNATLAALHEALSGQQADATGGDPNADPNAPPTDGQDPESAAGDQQDSGSTSEDWGTASGAQPVPDY